MNSSITGDIDDATEEVLLALYEQHCTHVIDGETYFLASPGQSIQDEIKQAIIEKSYDILTPEEERRYADLVHAAVRKELDSWIEHGTVQQVAKSGASNIIDCRWLFKWKLVEGSRVVKARLVVRGFKDQQAEELSNFAGTASRWSQRLIVSTAARYGWTILTADVNTAFLRGLTFEQMSKITGEPLRVVHMSVPTRHAQAFSKYKGFENFKPEIHVLRLLKPVYGLKDAPKAWRMMLHVYLSELQGKQLLVDRQIYMWHDENNKLTMLVSTHVDDMKVTGDPAWIKWLCFELEKKVGKLTIKHKSFEHCGVQHEQREDGSIIMHQNHYVKQLKAIALPSHYNAKDPLPSWVNSAFQTLLGGLSWLCLTRYDIAIYVCAMQRAGKSPTYVQAESANKVLRWCQRNVFECTYPVLQGPTRVVCISDSAFKKEDQEGLAMRGALICIVERHDWHPGGNLHVIEHYSRKQKRVVRSTFAAEINALVDSYEFGKLLMFALCELECGPMKPEDLIRLDDIGRWPMPLELVVDAYAVFSTAAKLESKNPTEETLITLVMVLREGLKTGRISAIWWVDTRDMIADGLNKGIISRDALLHTAHTGNWSLLQKAEKTTFADAYKLQLLVNILSGHEAAIVYQ